MSALPPSTGILSGASDGAPYTYELPEERIAQRPVYPYDAAKLLRLDNIASAGACALRDHVFADLPALLTAGDLLVLNNSVVKPARFFGQLTTGGSAELLLVGERGANEFEALARPVKKLKPGTNVIINEQLTFSVLQRLSEKTVLVRASSKENPLTHASSYGSMPIPPYIRFGKGDARDVQDYQSRFAGIRSATTAEEQDQGFGSIAAPTASLHFTDDLVSRLDAMGVERAYITLDVGLASVLSVVQEDGSVRPPGPERVNVPPETSVQIVSTRRNGGRVVAVGTTVVRALESAALSNSSQQNTPEMADIFIKPGHVFKNLDCVITNFHQPASSHLLLIEALLGRKNLAVAYQHALANDYRFLSYGDAMFIERPVYRTTCELTRILRSIPASS